MSWFTRLRNTLNPKRLDTDLADEIRDHIERRAAHLETNGLTPAEARRRASLQFGNRTIVRETSRDLKLSAAFHDTVQDVRYAWRGLIRNPAFALTAIVSLSLAIGANTAIYSIIDAVMLRPLPVPQPDRLFNLSSTGGDEAFSYPLWEQLNTAAGDAGRIALLGKPNRMEAQLGGAAASYEEVIEQFVSPNAFDTLGVPPALGRLLSPDEDRFPSPRSVAVISHEYWRRRFGANPGVLGQTVIVHGKTLSIIGVARAGFTGAEPGKFVDLWVPVTLTDPGIFTSANFRVFHLIGRLAPGATRDEIAARLQPAFQKHQGTRIDSSMPQAMRDQLRKSTIVVDPGATGSSAFRHTFAKPLTILLSVAACILLIACANVASLLLARSLARAPELSLRVALGARRARLIRQLLTESLLISFLAGLGGWALAHVTAPLLVSMVSRATDPVTLDLGLDVRVLAFCALVCALSSLLFALLPAWQATAAPPLSGLRHLTGRLRLGRIFVGVQVAFSFCLVIAGTGFLFSLRQLATVDTGFNPKGVTVLTISNTPQRDRQLTHMQQLQMRVGALPNMQGTATGWMAVFSGARRADRIILPGMAPSEREETFYRVSPNYFATLRTPLLEGRDFDFRDDDTEPVPSIVNRAFESRYFAGRSALGQEFRRIDGVRHRIIGIAANSHFGTLRGGPEPIAYMPMKPPLGFTLYARSTLDPGTVAKLVDREAAALGKGIRVRDVTTVETLIGNTILNERLLAAIGGALALLGLTLAGVGLFGLLNYAVTQRTREFGIRVALGSARLPLYGLVLREVTGMMAGGLCAGLVAAVVLMRFAQSLLYGTAPADPVVIGTAITVFLFASALASGLPARRAAAINPIEALRQ